MSAMEHVSTTAAANVSLLSCICGSERILTPMTADCIVYGDTLIPEDHASITAISQRRMYERVVYSAES